MAPCVDGEVDASFGFVGTEEAWIITKSSRLLTEIRAYRYAVILAATGGR
jgi:hypothetical protein